MILVLRALGVGDLATAAPALRGLRLAFPRRRLVLAAPHWLAPLAELIGGVDEVVPAAGLTGPLPVRAPALAVNLHGRGPESHLLLRATGPGHLWGFRCAQAEHLDGPVWDPEEHEVRRWCRLLNWYGVDADPQDLGLRRPAPDSVPVGATVVHPGTKEAAKRPPVALFAAAAAELHRRGHHVVVTGSAAERGLAERVTRDAGLPPTAVLAGRTTLTDLAALVAHARLVLAPDTGVAHLATAYGTPSVVLFGPVPARHWGPPAHRRQHRVLETGRHRIADGGVGEGSGSPALDELLAAVDEVEEAVRVRGAVATG